MLSDDEPYFKNEFNNGYLIEVCRDSMTASESIPKEKSNVLIKLLGEAQYFLFHLGNQKQDKQGNIVKPQFDIAKNNPD